MVNFDWKELSAFISGAGFSVFVALWFMVKHDKRLHELTLAIWELRDTLRICHRLPVGTRGAGVGGSGDGS